MALCSTAVFGTERALSTSGMKDAIHDVQHLDGVPYGLR